MWCRGESLALTALHKAHRLGRTVPSDQRQQVREQPPRPCMWGLPMSYIGSQVALLPPRLQTVRTLSTKSCPRDSDSSSTPQLTSTPQCSLANVDRVAPPTDRTVTYSAVFYLWLLSSPLPSPAFPSRLEFLVLQVWWLLLPQDLS